MYEHNQGYSPYTKQFSEISLVYKEDHPSKRSAERRERQLKSWSVAKKKALIDGDKSLLIELSKSHELVDE